MKQEKRFQAKVEEVHSGDDLVLMVDLGVDGLHKRVRARLKGVDTPSAFKARGNTEAGEVRDTLKSIIAEGAASVILHTEGKGGWLITLLVSSNNNPPINVNALLIEKGYVYKKE